MRLSLSKQDTVVPVNKLEREAVVNSDRAYRVPRFMAPRLASRRQRARRGAAPGRRGGCISNP